MIGDFLENEIPQVLMGKPEENWYRRLIRVAFEMKDLFEAGKHKKLIGPPAPEQALVAATAIVVSSVTVRLTSSGAITLTAAPTIADGEDGQFICLTNVGSNNIILQDQGTLSGSNLRLTAASVTMTPRDSLWLRFDKGIGDWLQVTTLVGVL